MSGTAGPILSDDGWWQWDGAAWVPAANPPTAAAPAIPAQAVPAQAVRAQAVPARAVADQAALPGYRPATGYPPATGYSPPGYGGPSYPTADRGRDGLAVAALVCSLIPIVAVAQVLALIFAVIVLTRVGRTGQKGQVMAIVAIALSVVMFFLSAAIAIPVFLNQRTQTYDARARIALRNTANAEETYFIQNQTFATVDQLGEPDTQIPDDTEIVIEPDGSAGYCLAAGRIGGTRWLSYDSFHGGLLATVFASATAAIETCATSAGAAPGGAAT